MSLNPSSSNSTNPSPCDPPTQSLALRSQITGGDFHQQIQHAPFPPDEPGINPMELRHLGENLKIIPVPSVVDDLETTAKKMEALAKVVGDGNSLALWTGLKLASAHPRDPESIAKSQMTPPEIELYEAWQRAKSRRAENKLNSEVSQKAPETEEMGCPAPFDWQKNVHPVPQGAQSLKKFTQRAQAMDIIWEHQGAMPEHASWLTFKCPEALPLVKAVCRVQNAEEHYRNNQDPHTRGLTDMEAAEVETVRKIVSIAERNKTRELEKIRKLTRSINEAAAVLKARVQWLEDKMKS
ncbi:uncharacterized protein ACLA_093280 [Aspergillus clavatus NRRL 1]|uniref:Uncharacterized protein n=1 Tax=Aspergillus clavatus (strain ATCC 1007 / CBS 513.65 / DSM 816 / NCTC 3887 / NRRL 1 / QM 1276 / 107) TaxID=344612 RepID=A1CFI0_ASPCL|nr:uncharacterized protein ACLA_093280 [Aspergillus clavatus NRRL 1]EAW11629.1 conserved hypothetical protein [Aspergillus clavatus NRRL 1]